MSGFDESLIFDAFHLNIYTDSETLETLWYTERHMRVDLRICNRIFLAGFPCDELQRTEEARCIGGEYDKNHMKARLSQRKYDYT